MRRASPEWGMRAFAHAGTVRPRLKRALKGPIERTHSAYPQRMSAETHDARSPALGLRALCIVRAALYARQSNVIWPKYSVISALDRSKNSFTPLSALAAYRPTLDSRRLT